MCKPWATFPKAPVHDMAPFFQSAHPLAVHTESDNGMNEKWDLCAILSPKLVLCYLVLELSEALAVLT